MSNAISFFLKNTSPRPLIVIVEPEAHEVLLQQNELIGVQETFDIEPLTLQFSTSDQGDPALSVWPGDGRVTVTKNGVDVLDLQ